MLLTPELIVAERMTRMLEFFRSVSHRGGHRGVVQTESTAVQRQRGMPAYPISDLTDARRDLGD